MLVLVVHSQLVSTALLCDITVFKTNSLFCSDFCMPIALMSEKRKDYSTAMDGYAQCLKQLPAAVATAEADCRSVTTEVKCIYLRELKGEIMLRMATLSKDMGDVEEAMTMCHSITGDLFSEAVRANALCLKV